ncbi:MAG: heme exporter protein CcmD [gamma proteobacterium symbiont of Taylorina sp.]|nr:heme exporter protein CcmD [gamma proteobacterium symbiont of Taylorina sp.]
MFEMLQMGKYGAYVWSSYGLALIVMGYVVIKPVMDKKTILKDLMMKYHRESHQHIESHQLKKEQENL